MSCCQPGVSASFCRIWRCSLETGYLFLVIIAVVNAAIAVYYYLCVVREACFRDPGNWPLIRLD